MKIQVLLSTMNQVNSSILNKLNLQTEAIVVNQTDNYSYNEFVHNKKNVKWFNMKEKGVGLSRNTALDRANADICLFADDDLTYINNYNEVILKAFQDNPKADVLIFNVESKNKNREEVKITKTKRLYFHTALKYGAVRIAIKLDKIRLENIHFSLLFGGGAKYSAGEDVIFITDCIKKRLKVYSIPINIGTVEQKESTWFNGYTDKVFIDRGIYYTCLSKTWAIPLCIQYAIRHYKLFCKEKTRKEALNLMLQGVKQAKRMKK